MPRAKVAQREIDFGGAGDLTVNRALKALAVDGDRFIRISCDFNLIVVHEVWGL